MERRRSKTESAVAALALLIVLVLALHVPVPTDYQVSVFSLIAFVAASVLLARGEAVTRRRVARVTIAGATVVLGVNIAREVLPPPADWLRQPPVGLRGEILAVHDLDASTRRGIVRARIASSAVAAIAVQPRLDGRCWLQRYPRPVREGEVLELEAEFGGGERIYDVWLLLTRDAAAFAGGRQLADCAAAQVGDHTVTKIGPQIVEFDRPPPHAAAVGADTPGDGIVFVAADSSNDSAASRPADAQPLPQILSPKDGEEIPRAGIDPPCSERGACTIMTVQGRVTPGTWPFVGVAALRSGRFWIQPAVPIVGRDGSFRALAYVGDERGGSGEWFTIVVLSHRDRDRLHERDILDALPPDCDVSEPVSVRRTR